jgi:hypothetical protein
MPRFEELRRNVRLMPQEVQVSALHMSLRERVEAKNSVDGELAPAQGGGSFGNLVCFVVELSKHMKKVDFMKGVREP